MNMQQGIFKEILELHKWGGLGDGSLLAGSRGRAETRCRLLQQILMTLLNSFTHILYSHTSNQETPTGRARRKISDTKVVYYLFIIQQI